MYKVAVFFGGISNENEVSVITGTMTANVLKSAGYEVTPVYMSQSGGLFTGKQLLDVKSFGGEKFNFPRAIVANGGVYTLSARGKIKGFAPVDVAVNCCHGGDAEGGAICGLCSVAGIPLASAGTFESAAFMDKYITKLVLAALGVKTAEYRYISSVEAENLPTDFPLIVKPVSLGSSIAVERVDDINSLKAALQTALIYDSGAIIEKYLAPRREINCAAYFYKGKVITSECEEAVSDGAVFSFEDKYKGGGKSVLPADIPEATASEIKLTTEKVYKKLNMRGIVRFDYILCGGEVYLSEINTVPGSLSYYLLSGGFKDFADVLKKVIEQAVADYKEKSCKKLIKTGILKGVGLNVNGFKINK